MELNPIELANNQATPIKELEANIQSKSPYAESNQRENEFLKSLTGYSDLAGGVSIQPKKQKLSMTDEVSIMETHNLAPDGDWIAKYPTYKIGRDNAEYAAQNQDTWDKWANGLTKAGANFSTTVVGNTLGIVYGATNGIKEGSWNAVFDNNFSNALADWNEKLGYKLPNYVSQQEKDASLLGSLGTANFWANDVAGAFSFTLGTIVSEGIWAMATGGSANIAKAGLKGAQAIRWSKNLLGEVRALKGIADYKSFLSSGTRKLFTKTDDVLAMTNNAISKSTRAKWLNTARFLATTSGNEAGIEALHYKREQEDNFYENFSKQNGREPSEEEIKVFNNNLENSANLVFASNMAILAPSNLAMFGSLFNISSPFRGVSKTINKSLFGVGVEKTAEGVYQGIKATGKQKAGRIAYAGLKPLVTEGIWEEGLQGVTTKSAENWITSTFNPKYNNESMALSQATAMAFGEQYGTKEGWKEMVIGMIVGGGTSLVIGKGKFQELREFEKAQEYQDTYVAKGMNQFGDNSSTASMLFTQRMMLNSRIKSAIDAQTEAVKKGDDIGVILAQQDPLIAEIQFRKAIGEDTKELLSKYEIALEALPQESWDEAGIQDIEEYKKSVLNGYKSLIANHEKASDFADAILGETRVLGQNVQTQILKDALTYSIVSGQTANKAMDMLLQDMSKIIGEDNVKAKTIQTELQRLGKNKQEQIRKINIKINQAENEEKSLTDELERLQVSKDETKGERLQKVREKLTESLDRINQLKQERELLAQDVSQEIKRRRTLDGIGLENNSLVNSDFITGEDLANIEKKLNRIEDTIKSYEGVNHQLYYELLDLQKQYGLAKEKFFSYQNSIDAIVSGQFAPKFSKVEGLLGKIFGQKEYIDDFTSEFLTEINNNYQNSLGRTGVDLETQSQYISNEDYELFKGTGEISNEIKQQLSERVKSKELLSEREKEIYSVLTQEINNLTKVSLNPNKPDLSRQTIDQKEIERLQEQKRALEEELEKTSKTINVSQTNKTLLERLRELPVESDKVTDYNEAIEIVNSIDFNDENSITEGISKIANKISGKDISATTQTPEKYVRAKEKLIGNDNYRTKEYLESYINITLKNFSNTKNFFDVNKNVGKDVLGEPTISQVEDGSLYEFKTEDGLVAGVLISPTEFRIDGITAFEVGKGKGSKMFEALIEYLKSKGVSTISTISAGEGAVNMHNKAVEKGLLNKVKEEGRTATFEIINNNELEELNSKLDKLKQNFLNAGKTEKEASKLALDSISEAELQLLREEYKKDRELEKEESNTVEKLNPRYQSLEKEIVKIDKKINSLKTVDKDLSEAEKLRKDLANAMQTDYPLITIDVDELLKEKPTQEEIDRYANLYKKIDRLDLFEQKEFEELQPRMQKWFMAQSLPSLSGMSVADVAELIEQLETQVGREQTVTEITVEDILESTESNDARAINRIDILQNLAGSAVTKIQDGKIYFAQIDIRNIVEKLLQEGVNIAEIKTVNKEGKLTKEKQLTSALLNQNYNITGTEFKIGEIKINVGERGNIVMTLEDYNKSKDIINLYYFNSKTGKWSWSDLYEEVSDGRKRKKQSEYSTNTNSETIYNSEQGDDLNLFVDMNTDWNQNLIDESLQEVAKNDELSEELKDKIRRTLEITSKNGRENISTLKATGKDVSDDNFMLIRKRFSDKFIELVETEGVATLPKKIDLDVEVPISEMFLGTPDFILDASNTPIEFAITERGTEEVISQGYVLGQETILADKKVKVEEVSRLFVSNVAKANPEAKIPVVLLKKGKHQFVFPISLIKTAENQVEKLNSILEKEQDFIQTRKEVNNLMISLGLNTRLVSDSDIQLENIREELEQYTTFRTADELADVNYDKNRLISDATIKIDLEDTLISSPKITVDYSKATIGTSEENEKGAIELRKDIVKDIIEIRNIVNRSPEIPDQSRFVNAFAENDVQNQGTDIMNRKDVNFIRKTFFNQGNKIPIQDKDIAVKTIGKERLLKLRSKLEMLNFYEEQIKTAKDKATLNKLNCK